MSGLPSPTGLSQTTGLSIGQGLGLGYGLAFQGFTSFSPASLFAAGEQGVWYDPSDFSTMFQDSAGTTPVTAVEQPVGLLLDKSQGLVLGPELVTNGNFSAGSTGWTQVSGSWTFSGGRAIAANTDSIKRLSNTTSSMVAGRWYKITWSQYAGVGTGAANWSIPGVWSGVDNFANGGSYINGEGEKTVYFLAPVSGQFYLYNFEQAVEFDNISVKELPGNHATQSTTASRPVLSARVNLLTYSEQFDNAVWSKTNATVTPDVIVAPNASLTADKLVEGVGTARKYIVQSGAQPGQTFSVYAQKGERDYIALGQTNTAGIWAVSLFNINLGTYVGSYQAGGVSTPTNNTIISVGSGWYIVSCTLNVASIAQSSVIMIGNGGDPIFEGYTGNGTSGIYIWGADLRPANQTTLLPAYQRIAAATDYDTTGFPYYLRFDGTDDSMATGTITPGIDKVQAFSGVRKQSDAASALLVEYSTSDVNNGSFSMLAPGSSGGNSYRFASRGTNSSLAGTGAFATAPNTSVLTGLGDISGDVSTLRRNGSLVETATTDQGTGNYLAYQMFLGRRGGTANPFNGNLFSLIVRFGTNLDATTISNTETWVNGKTLAY